MRALFFYGVLMPELATGRMAELVALLEPGQAATVAGDLYGIAEPEGHHPAMVVGEGAVNGRLHLVGTRFGAAELAEMDAYEGDAYVRTPVAALLVDGSSIDAEAYVWTGPTTGLAPILHGDFARYLAESGAPALPG
jgi:gamma-glutamylcyclotransferase (GGCT)/AIG2-like uncharacterized protein YtfP